MRKISEYSLKKASEHIFYEAWMFFETMNYLMQARNQISTNILLDAYAIHCRNLFDFLYPDLKKIKRDDILVFDYISDKSLYYKNKTKKKLLRFVIRKANKQVAHLTYTRNRYGEKNKPWPFLDIAKEIHKSLSVFYEAMPDKYKKWPYFIKLKEVLDTFNL